MRVLMATDGMSTSGQRIGEDGCAPAEAGGVAPYAAPAALDEHDPEAAFERHLVEKASAARARFGPVIDADGILAILNDPKVVRYPTSILFDASQLQPHEFAWPRPLGFHPADGYCLLIDPIFAGEAREDLPLVIAYHIPSINYGAIVEHRHAEIFTAALLGLERETCYRQLCRIADQRGSL